MVCVFPWSDKDQPTPVLILLKCTVQRSPPQSWQATSTVSMRCSEGGQNAARLSQNIFWRTPWRSSHCQLTLSHQFETPINITFYPKSFKYHFKKKRRKAHVRIATACSYSYVHMKLMLFTDFLQTHQSNLRPSDRFPLLDSTKKIFGGGGVWCKLQQQPQGQRRA